MIDIPSDVEVSAVDGSGAFCRLVFDECIRYGFPRPEIVDSLESLIDTSRPTVVLPSAVNRNSMTVARELDKLGDLNVVVFSRIPPSDASGVYRDIEAVVYRNGCVFIGKLLDVCPDYVYQDFTESDYHDGLPMSGGRMLNFVIRNKEVANAAMDSGGVQIPRSVVWRGNTVLDESRLSSLNVRYQDCDGVDSIRRAICDFCYSNGCDEIVVKPSNGLQGIGVRFFMASEFMKAAEYVLSMMSSAPSVILQERIKPLTKMGKDWNLRVFVSRDDANKPVVSDVLVRLDDDRRGPVNLCVSAVPMTLNGVSEFLGLSTDRTERLRSGIEDVSLAVFRSVENAVIACFSRPCDQDWIGVDIIVAERDGEFVFYVIEVNNDYTGGMYALDSVLPESQKGSACQHLVKLIKRRAFGRFGNK